MSCAIYLLHIVYNHKCLPFNSMFYLLAVLSSTCRLFCDLRKIFGLNIFISFKRTFMVTNIQLYNDTYINRKGFRRKSSDLF